MKEFKKILFPVDLSESSGKILPYVQTVAEKIIEYIEDQKIDLVIMGTHGRKGMDKIIFGSVAERVVKTSPVPVMVVNPFK